MLFKKDTIGAFPCLRVSGRVVRIDSEMFRDELNTLCDRQDAEKIIIDFSQTDFIDSYGLGALIHHYNSLLTKGRELIVLNKNYEPQTYVRRLFEMTGLDQILTVVESEMTLL